MTFEAPSDHTTLAEVLTEFEADGYSGTFEVEEDGAVRCLTCDRRSDPDALDLYAIRRLEGASDPADMAAVLATRCSQCGTRGVIVARYGPEASAGEARLLQASRDLRHSPASDVERLDPDAPGRSLFVEDEDAVEPNEPG